MDQETKSFNEIMDILKRRKMVFAVTAISVFIVALAVATPVAPCLPVYVNDPY